MPTDITRTGPWPPQWSAIGRIAARLIAASSTLAAIAAIGTAVSGCMAPGMDTSDGRRASTLAPETTRMTPSSGTSEPAYIRFRAEELGLELAVDDGRFTYLSFAAPPIADLEPFDADGKPLPRAAVGRVLAVQGLHQGILVRRGDRASFIAPNPRAVGLPRRPLPDGDEHPEARARLENQAGLMQAMQRALDGARVQVAPVGSAAVIGPQVHGLAGSSSRESPRSPSPLLALPQSLPSNQTQFSQSLPPSTALPLAFANASSSVPEQGVIRVYFATASRAIVAPEDGLGLLMREAVRADQIRVTGFTDATGTVAVNESLARARADAVVQILVRRGVSPDRIVTHAIAAASFIGDNASQQGRALNRRVEVVLLRGGMPLPLNAATASTGPR